MDAQGSGGPGADDTADERIPTSVRRVLPENEIPEAVAVNAILARTDDVVIAMIGGHAYTCGLGFDLAIRFRQGPQGTMKQRSAEMFGALSGRPDPDQQLVLRVEYADGRAATHVGSRLSPADPADSAPEMPSLSPLALRGTGNSLDQSLWLSPLPPSGPLEVVCSWPAHDVPESRTVLDGAAIAEAGSRAVVLWPRPHLRPPGALGA